MKHMTVDRELAEQHYAEHAEKPFFGDLVDFITGGPLVALVLEGHEAVKAARQVIGATNPLEAAPGSIRGDFGLEVQTNLVHGSDSPESAAREVGLFFPEPADPAASQRSPAAAGDPASSSASDFARRGARRRGARAEGDPRDAGRRERAAQGARACAGELVLGVDTVVVLDGRASASRPTRRRPRAGCASCPGAPTR